MDLKERSRVDVVGSLRVCRGAHYGDFPKALNFNSFGCWHGSCNEACALVESITRENTVHYRKYTVRTQLFSLRDPRLSEQVLAAFSGAAGKRLPPPPPPRHASEEDKR